jgi:hypothetical protein
MRKNTKTKKSYTPPKIIENENFIGEAGAPGIVPPRPPDPTPGPSPGPSPSPAPAPRVPAPSY